MKENFAINENSSKRCRYIDIAIFALFAVSIIPLLLYVPKLFPPSTGIESAAAVLGYNNRVAHILAVTWIGVMIFLSYIVQRQQPGCIQLELVSRENIPLSFKRRFIEILVVCVGTFVLFFPLAMARYGPFLEEHIHLTAIHRMLAGDIPYQDFEFLYGPLMLYLPYFWCLLFGYTLASFYTYVACIEVLVFGLLLFILQTRIHRFGERLFVFVLFAATLFNPLIGPNQNGLRKLLPLLLLLSIIKYPFSKTAWFLNGIGLGLVLAYSHEIGFASSFAIVSIYIMHAINSNFRRSFHAIAIIASTSALVWFLVIWALLGPAFLSYLSELLLLTSRFNAGEAAFSFYWTANSLSIFGLIFIGTLYMGKSIIEARKGRWNANSALLIGGLMYTIVSLKSGLSRADQWHLIAIILILAFAIVVPMHNGVSIVAGRSRNAARIMLVVLSLSYFYGNKPFISHYVHSLKNGFVDIVKNVPISLPTDPQPLLPALIYDRTHMKNKLDALSGFFSRTPWRGVPVVAYGGNWAVASYIGVKKAGFLADNYIYSDERGLKLRQFLIDTPNAVVIIKKAEYEWLLQGAEAEARVALSDSSGGDQMGRELRSLLSSVHVKQLRSENILIEKRWRRLIGNYVADKYSPVYRSDSYYVLALAKAKKQVQNESAD